MTEEARTEAAADKRTATADLAEVAGQYLTFKLGEETYGLQILTVQEIIKLMEVTRVPRTPDYVRGVINLRGKVIPVVELRKKFSMTPAEDNDLTCIIVVQVNTGDQTVIMGIIVDEVSEVLDVAGNQIEPAPSFGAAVPTEFILGMGKVADKVVMLLDVDKVLEGSEVLTARVGQEDS